MAGELELIAMMNRSFAATLDLEVTLSEALASIVELLGAEAGSLFLSEGEEIVCHACVGDVDVTGLRLPSGAGIVGNTIDENRSQIVRDVSKDPNFQASVDEKTGFTTRSIVCAPMSVKDERIGAIELINKQSGDGLFDQPDIHALEALSSSAGLAILNARLAQGLVEQERVRRELELASEIQRNLLPDADAADWLIQGINVPAREVSGDFYDYFRIGDGRVAFSVGDVSGKGMNAALLMAKTLSVYRCLGKTVDQPGEVMRRVNEEVCETSARGMFVTMVGGVFDPKSGIVRLANAGHEPPLHHTKAGKFASIPAAAPPIGIANGAEFPEVEIDLDGGSLYVFTDGVTEAPGIDTPMLGSDGFEKLVGPLVSLTLEQRLATLVARIARPPLRDDLTLLCVEGRAREERGVVEPR